MLSTRIDATYFGLGTPGVGPIYQYARSRLFSERRFVLSFRVCVHTAYPTYARHRDSCVFVVVRMFLPPSIVIVPGRFLTTG